LIQSGTADVAAITAQSAVVAAAELNFALLQAQEYNQFLALLTTAQAQNLSTIQAAQQTKFQQLITNITNGNQQ